MGVKRTATSVKRKKCTFKSDLIYSHGLLPLDSTGRSTCQFCICFGREETPLAEAARAESTGSAGASAVLPNRKRAVSRRHLMFDDFSRHRIEEHYTKSHPKQWALYQRAVSQRGRSSRTNNSFFQAERITGHFARRDPSGRARLSQRPSGTLLQGYFRRRRTPPPELPPASFSRRFPQRMTQAMMKMTMNLLSSSTLLRFPPGRRFSA
jgi:hypothetical protein